MNRLIGTGLVIGSILAAAGASAADAAAPGTGASPAVSATLKDAIENKAPPNKWSEMLKLGLTANGTIQGSLNADTRLADKNHTDASGKLSLSAMLFLWNEDSLYLKVKGGDGKGIDGDIPSFSRFNDEIFDEDKIQLSEYWYETMQFDRRLILKIGKIDMTGSTCTTEHSFDSNLIANDGNCSFMSSAFVNNRALEFPAGNTPAAMAWYRPVELLNFGVGVAKTKDEWSDVFDKPFGIVQATFLPAIGGRTGNYRLYAWLNNRDHASLSDESELTEQGHGFGLSFDQELTDDLSAFCRYGWERPEVYEIEHALSAGLRAAGSCYGRDKDAIGLAYGVGLLSGEFKDVQEASGIDAGDEHHVELYYSFAANKYLSITPDVQWVLNPVGDKDNDSVWVLGTRAVVKF